MKKKPVYIPSTLDALALAKLAAEAIRSAPSVPLFVTSMPRPIAADDAYRAEIAARVSPENRAPIAA